MLAQAIRDGLALLTCQTDTFAYAESYDDGPRGATGDGAVDKACGDRLRCRGVGESNHVECG